MNLAAGPLCAGNQERVSVTQMDHDDVQDYWWWRPVDSLRLLISLGTSFAHRHELVE